MARFLVLLIICVLAIWHVLLVSLSIRRGLDDVQMHESGHLLACCSIGMEYTFSASC
jgi:hypothetical protein